MNLRRFALPIVLALLAVPAHAHFLWLTVAKDSGGEPIVQLCFSEVGQPGEHFLVDQLEPAKVLVHKAGAKPVVVETKKEVNEKTGFRGAAAVPGASYSTSLEYGVRARGEENYLLNYTAKYLDLANPESLQSLARAENLRLDVVPSVEKDQVTITVLFDGKPIAAGSQVKIEAPNVGQDEHTTDANGKVTFKITETGHYEVRARYQHNQAGERQGKKYPHEMYYGTLVLNVPARK